MADITQKRLFDIVTHSPIIEIANEQQTINVPVDLRVDVDVLTSDDPNPMFVNVEVVRTGISKTNRRKYDNTVVNQISEMIPGTLGYLGHPDPAKTSFEFREPHTIFVGSIVQEMADGGIKSIAKAYIFKSSHLREWIPKSIAAGRPLTVSINALGDIINDATNKLIHVKRVTQLDSIDWANPGTEGFGTSQALSVVSELQNQDDKGGSQMSENRQDVVKGITLAEMKAYNPDIVASAIKGVTIAEFQATNPELYKQIQESGRIAEMQLTIGGEQKTVKIAEMQETINGYESKIQKLEGDIETSKITEYKTRKIAEVPEQYRDAVAKRVIGKTEKEIDTAIESELAYIKEIAGNNWDNPPRGNGAKKTDGDIEAQVKNLFGVKKSK